MPCWRVRQNGNNSHIAGLQPHTADKKTGRKSQENNSGKSLAYVEVSAKQAQGIAIGDSGSSAIFLRNQAGWFSQRVTPAGAFSACSKVANSQDSW